MALEDLERTYLNVAPGAPPIFRGNTEITPLIDGVAFFDALHAAISGTAGPGDAVFVVAWQIDIAWNLLTGNAVPDTDPGSLAQLLAGKAAAGVDVRLILNGSLYINWLGPAPFGRNLRAARRLRELKVPGAASPPLQASVLFDWSGAPFTGSHHQKATVVKTGPELVAFLGGMDARPDFRDELRPDNPANQHNSHAWCDTAGSPWGWHDNAVRLRGAGARRVWDNFRQRWNEVLTLPGRMSQDRLSDPPRPLNPLAKLDPGPAPAAPTVTSNQSVQVLRSRYMYKIANKVLPGGTPWTGPESGGLYEVWDVYRKAIAAAERYIYVEDQFLADSAHLEIIFSPGYSLYPEIAKALAAKPTLRVIFVGSGKSDPGDFFCELRNQALTGSIRDDVLKPLDPATQPHVAVWRVEDVTVHSKLMLIDDIFAAVGSCNLQARSMYGIDSELQAAVVADDSLVKRLRCDLWAEHWQLKPFESAEVDLALDDIDAALGLWRPEWSGDPAMWRTPGNPTGYSWPRGKTGRGAVAPVGPLPLD
jgi:phosphatidylserine/phosphatidylglycerophosphate/cardiolipin synthase-like enzyme